MILIQRNSPPRGGFLFTMFPHEEPCVRGPPSKDLYQVLRGGSSYSRFVMREHSKYETPPGGGFLSINMQKRQRRQVFLCAEFQDRLVCIASSTEFRGSHVTHSYVCHVTFPCVTWLIHTCDIPHPYVWLDSFIRVTCLMQTRQWKQGGLVFAASHLWMSHTTHMIASCHTLNASCHTYEWVMSHIWMSHVTHTNESCHTCEWAMSHIWMSHATHVDDSFIYVAWLIHMCDMAHSHMWHDSFICVTWLIHICGMTHSYVWHGSFICVTWLIHICSMTPHIQCVMPHIWKRHATHVDESCHTYEWVMSQPRNSPSSLLPFAYEWVMCVSHTYGWVMCVSHVWMSHVTHVSGSCVCHTCEWVTV